ncbi:hypothetical protein GBA52_016302 [Prunus armeniaca]|nr:hypothetical protein GBA52_016302 [Prunus armeniaca]
MHLWPYTAPSWSGLCSSPLARICTWCRQLLARRPFIDARSTIPAQVGIGVTSQEMTTWRSVVGSAFGGGMIHQQ